MSAPETQALLSLIERDWGVFVESAAHAWMGWSVGEAGRLAADAFRNATTPAVARATFQAASGIDVSKDLAAVTAPTLVLHRADIEQIPRTVSEELAAALPNGHLRLLAGSSPALFFENTDEVVGAITPTCRPAITASGCRPATVGCATDTQYARTDRARARCLAPNRPR